MLRRMFSRSQSTLHRSTSFVYPQRLTRSPTAILQSLNSCVETDGNNPAYLYVDDPFFIPTSAYEKRQFALSKSSGKKAARWIIDRYSYAFFHDVAVPSIPSYFPRYSFDERELAEPDETTIFKLMNWNQILKAYEIYQTCLKDNLSISDACKYALFDLLCIYNSENPVDLLPPEENWYRRELSENNQSSRQILNTNSMCSRSIVFT
jgi:pentatricopeptide repeat domain-containing protein 3